MEFLEKIYDENPDDILSAVSDMMELQKGTITFSDTPHGKVSYRVELYDVPYEFHITVSPGNGNCKVRIETSGRYGDAKNRVKQVLHLLESMLV